MLSQARTGKLATVRDDGRPHVVPVWFDLDGDSIIFTTWHSTVKARNIRRDPRVALCVDDETPPFSYLMVEGTATLSDDPDDLLRWATRIGGRYMGRHVAEAYGRRNSVEGELLGRITLTRVILQRNIAD